MPINHKKPAQSKAKGIIGAQKKDQIVVPRKIALAIIVICLLGFNVIILGALFKMEALRSQSNEIISLNEIKTYNGVSIEVTNIKTETGYIMGIKPDGDQKIISLEINIVNKSGKDFDFYPTAQSFIRDNQGSNFIIVPVSLTNPFQATTIKNGETKNGQLSFMVPNRDVPLFLYIESRQDVAGPFVFKVQ